jgi:hypothetical protein
MRLILIALALSVATSAPAAAPKGSPLIDFNGYLKLTEKVRPYRAKRLLSLDTFKAQSRNKNVLVLDARSAQAFAEGHIEGAINLPFPDFTAESLAAAIGPDRDRRILIYCNNNFTDNRRPVVTKALPLALNIQTFVNLYGYGYKNVWELGEAVQTTDARVGWIRSAELVGRKAALVTQRSPE